MTAIHRLIALGQVSSVTQSKGFIFPEDVKPLAVSTCKPEPGLSTKYRFEYR